MRILVFLHDSSLTLLFCPLGCPLSLVIPVEYSSPVGTSPATMGIQGLAAGNRVYVLIVCRLRIAHPSRPSSRVWAPDPLVWWCSRRGAASAQDVPLRSIRVRCLLQDILRVTKSTPGNSNRRSFRGVSSCHCRGRT